MILYLCKRCLIQGHKDFLLFSSRRFRILGIIFRSIIHFEFIFKFYFINLFIFSSVGSSLLRGLFSSFSEQGLLSSRCPWTSLCGGFPCCRAQALGHTGFSSCGTRAQWALVTQGMWNLPRPGIEPLSPALAGRFPSTVSPGSPCINFIIAE